MKYVMVLILLTSPSYLIGQEISDTVDIWIVRPSTLPIVPETIDITFDNEIILQIKEYDTFVKLTVPKDKAFLFFTGDIEYYFGFVDAWAYNEASNLNEIYLKLQANDVIEITKEEGQKLVSELEQL